MVGNLTNSKFSLFPKEIQKLFALMFFLISFPILKFGGISLSFFVFIFILIKLKIRYRSFRLIKFIDKTDYFVFFFLLWSLCSSIISQSYKNFELSFDFLLNIQLTYWCMLFLFIKNNFIHLDLQLIGKYSFYASILLIFSFYFYEFHIALFYISVNSVKSRNFFIYQIETILPLVLFFFHYSNNVKKLLLYIFYSFSAIFSNGRAGTILILVNFLFYLILSKILNKYILIICTLLLFLQLNFNIVDTKNFYMSVGESIRPYNPRIANLIENEEDGDLDFDKSWIERQIHISKGIEIFTKFPIAGIGLGNFDQYITDYNMVDLEDYVVHGSVRINEKTLQSFNNRSSHNSYIQILAELGLVGFILFISIIFNLVFGSLRYLILNFLGLEYLDLIIISTLCILIHNWVISAFTGANTFAILAVCYGYMKSKKLI